MIEICLDWYYGFKTKNHNLRGIFPKKFVCVRESVVDRSGLEFGCFAVISGHSGIVVGFFPCNRRAVGLKLTLATDSNCLGSKTIDKNMLDE